MIPPAARGVAAAPCTPRYRAGPQFKLDRVACHGVASMVAEVGQHLVEAQLQAVDLLFRNPQGRPAGPRPAGSSAKLLRIGMISPMPLLLNALWQSRERLRSLSHPLLLKLRQGSTPSLSQLPPRGPIDLTTRSGPLASSACLPQHILRRIG